MQISPERFEDIKDDLDDWLKRHPPTGNFRPHAQYNPDGDILEVYWEDERCYGEQLHDGLTLMRAESDSRVVGVKIYGREAMELMLKGKRGPKVPC